MDPNTRPNIITIGIFMGAFTQLICWVWNALGPLPMGAGEAAALTTVLTAAAQWLDRSSKRTVNHVLTKYGA